MSNQFNVKTYDKEGYLVNDDDFKSIASIHKAYPHLTYAIIRYLANYYEGIPRKPSKKIAEIMTRFEITNLKTNEDIFTKVQ